MICIYIYILYVYIYIYYMCIYIQYTMYIYIHAQTSSLSGAHVHFMARLAESPDADDVGGGPHHSAAWSP